MLSRKANAPGPETSILVKPGRSSNATVLRAAWHSSATTLRQPFLRKNESVWSVTSPFGSKYVGRSQPPRAPNAAPFAFSLSYKGDIYEGRPAGRSSNGKPMAYSFWYTSSARSMVYCVVAYSLKRRRSMPQMSNSGRPLSIHSAIAFPAPPPWAIPKLNVLQWKKLRRPRSGPMYGLPSGA